MRMRMNKSSTKTGEQWIDKGEAESKTRGRLGISQYCQIPDLRIGMCGGELSPNQQVPGNPPPSLRLFSSSPAPLSPLPVPFLSFFPLYGVNSFGPPSRAAGHARRRNQSKHRTTLGDTEQEYEIQSVVPGFEHSGCTSEPSMRRLNRSVFKLCNCFPPRVPRARFRFLVKFQQQKSCEEVPTPIPTDPTSQGFNHSKCPKCPNVDGLARTRQRHSHPIHLLLRELGLPRDLCAVPPAWRRSTLT